MITVRHYTWGLWKCHGNFALPQTLLLSCWLELIGEILSTPFYLGGQTQSAGYDLILYRWGSRDLTDGLFQLSHWDDQERGFFECHQKVKLGLRAPGRRLDQGWQSDCGIPSLGRLIGHHLSILLEGKWMQGSLSDISCIPFINCITMIPFLKFTLPFWSCLGRPFFKALPPLGCFSLLNYWKFFIHFISYFWCILLDFKTYFLHFTRLIVNCVGATFEPQKAG